MMSDKFFESLAKDSRSTLFEYLANRAELVRFFSYGSNMDKKKFRDDMKNAAENLKLKLSDDEKSKLALDKFSTKRVLLNFRRNHPTSLTNMVERSQYAILLAVKWREYAMMYISLCYLRF